MHDETAGAVAVPEVSARGRLWRPGGGGAFAPAQPDRWLTTRAARASALGHPGWLAALVVLVLNDHVLKGAGLLPGWFTGKLSDVAGLAMAPAALAALFGLRSTRAVAAVALLVGAAFAAINLSPAAAAWVERLAAETVFPWQVTVDPTDLLALPALVLGVWLWRQPLPQWWQPQASVRLAALPAAMVAMAGTSSPRDTCEGSSACNRAPWKVVAVIGIGNSTDDRLIVRVRSLSRSIELNCAAAEAAPSTFFDDAHFLPAEAFVLDPGQALPLPADDTHSCSVLLVDGPGIPRFLVFLRASEYPPIALGYIEADYPDESYRLIRVVPSGQAYAIAAHSAVYPDARVASDAECPLVATEDGAAWTPVPAAGEYEVLATNDLAGGCASLTLSRDGVPASFGYCLPGLEAHIEAGSRVFLRTLSYDDAGDPIEGFEALVSAPAAVSGQERAWRMRVGRGSGVPALGLPGVDAAVVRRDDCGLSVDACTNRGRLADVALWQGGEEVLRIAPGSSGHLGMTTIHVFRAAHYQLVDGEANCDVAFGYSVESAVIEALDRGMAPALGGAQ